jgi:hypothetical protein
MQVKLGLVSGAAALYRPLLIQHHLIVQQLDGHGHQGPALALAKRQLDQELGPRQRKGVLAPAGAEGSYTLVTYDDLPILEG